MCPGQGSSDLSQGGHRAAERSRRRVAAHSRRRATEESRRRRRRATKISRRRRRRATEQSGRLRLRAAEHFWWPLSNLGAEGARPTGTLHLHGWGGGLPGRPDARRFHLACRGWGGGGVPTPMQEILHKTNNKQPLIWIGPGPGHGPHGPIGPACPMGPLALGPLYG